MARLRAPNGDQMHRISWLPHLCEWPACEAATGSRWPLCGEHYGQLEPIRAEKLRKTWWVYAQPETKPFGRKYWRARRFHHDRWLQELAIAIDSTISCLTGIR